MMKHDSTAEDRVDQAEFKDTRCDQFEFRSLDCPQKFLLRVVATELPKPSCPRTHFFLASPNLGDEIPFKGGSM